MIARGLTTIYRIWAVAIGSALFLFAEVLAIKNGLDVRWIVMRLNRGGAEALAVAVRYSASSNTLGLVQTS